MNYRIIDEIEPVTSESWALHPDLPFYAVMMLPVEWMALVSTANSFLLGHPRRKFHAGLAVAGVMWQYAVILVMAFYVPERAWKYVGLTVIAAKLWLAYYLNEEQEWAAEMFKQAGGKVATIWTTLGLLRVLRRLVVRPARDAVDRLLVRIAR